jgi:GMP synthase-like glutamine amidotransferase
MHVRVLQHVAFEDAGSIPEWARRSGYTLGVTHPYAGEPLPPLEDFDLLVVMGGPMSVHDEDRHPWLRPEKQLISRTLEAGTPILGICLGSQLLAEVLGGVVTANPELEVGWHPVRWLADRATASLLEGFPKTVEMFHWHGETFSLPPSAIRLAESDACPNQGFAL